MTSTPNEQTIPPRRRRADAERSIASIVDAARGCFRQQPDATMTDIARAAGVGRVTLYAHFPSRLELLEAVVEQGIRETGAVLDEVIDDAQPAPDVLRALLAKAWHGVEESGRLLEAARRVMPPDRLRELHGPVVDQVATLISRGQRQGTFRADVPLSWLVTTTYGLMHVAAEAIASGELRNVEAPAFLEATLLPALGVHDGKVVGRPALR